MPTWTLSDILLAVLAVIQAALAIDRWVHKTRSDGATLSEDIRTLDLQIKSLASRVADRDDQMKALEEIMRQINNRSSDISGKVQWLLGRIDNRHGSD